MTKKNLLERIEGQQLGLNNAWREIDRLREITGTLLTRVTDINSMLSLEGRVLDERNNFDRVCLVVYRLLDYFGLKLDSEYIDDPSRLTVEQPKIKQWKIVKR